MENLCIQSEVEFRYLGELDFPSCYRVQTEIVEKKISIPSFPDFVLGVVHKECFTIGRGGDISEVINPVFPIYNTDRGGKVTYHGPGQLVIYVIMDIRKFGLRRYLDFLEEKNKELLLKLGVDNHSIITNFKGRGIWIKGKKVCFIGVGVRRWISYHGVSINLDGRIHRGFKAIIPCGLDPGEVSSLQEVYRQFSPYSVFQKFQELFNGSY